MTANALYLARDVAFTVAAALAIAVVVRVTCAPASSRPFRRPRQEDPDDRSHSPCLRRARARARTGRGSAAPGKHRDGNRERPPRDGRRRRRVLDTGARRAESDARGDRHALQRKTTAIQAGTRRRSTAPRNCGRAPRRCSTAYTALDDALAANAEAQRTYVETANAAVDRYNAGDDAGGQAAFATDVRVKLDELTQRAAAAVAAQHNVQQAEQDLQEVTR